MNRTDRAVGRTIVRFALYSVEIELIALNIMFPPANLIYTYLEEMPFLSFSWSRGLCSEVGFLDISELEINSRITRDSRGHD